MRLPYPLVWNRDSYNKIEPEVREKGKKREWIEWLLKNIVEGKGEKWTYEQWVLNAVDMKTIIWILQRRNLTSIILL
mgnify:CR=1 FL=1